MIRQRIQAEVQKMRAEGKNPEEIRAAIQGMMQRAMKAAQETLGQENGPPKAMPPQAAPREGRAIRPAQQRMEAIIQKMKAEGKSPEEIRQAAREMRKRFAEQQQQQQPTRPQPEQPRQQMF